MPGSARIKNIVLALLFIVSSYNFFRTASEIIKSSQKVDDLKQEVDYLSKQKEKLAQEAAYKQTDEYVEEMARNNLNMVKEGEDLFVVRSKTANDDVKGASVLPENNATDSASAEVPDSKGNWYKWYRLIF